MMDGVRALGARVTMGGNNLEGGCPPDVHVFTNSKQPWVELPENSEVFGEFFTGKDVVRIYGEARAARWKALRR